MPTKRKPGRRPAAKKRAKAKAGARKTRAKAKAGDKTIRAKAKGGARKAKRAPPRKRAPAPTGPVVLDEVLEESLLDVSTILRVKDGVARSQRDLDEDELKQFPDPSLVVEVVTMDPRRDADATDESDLPDLFAAEARRQKERAADEQAAGEPHRRGGSLFGSLGSSALDEDADGKPPSDDRDED